jgi:type VI secretion system protein ImpA
VLDPEDGLDPTMRVNVLRALADADSMLRAVRLAPLAEARVGRVCLRDVQVADEPHPEGEEEAALPTRAQLEGIFGACDLDDLRRRAGVVQRCLEELALVESVLLARLDPDRTPDLAPLGSLLEEARAVLSAHLPVDAGVLPGDAEDGRAPGDAGTNGAVRSREDVVRLLDRICAYYERQEPSSPVPLLLGRAKRLVAKDFMQIIRDIAPEGVQQMQTLAGIEHTEETDE